jgi:hypothetical protein
LAFQINQEIWTARLQPAQPPSYTLEDITVYPMDGLFAPIYQMPYVETINEPGTAAASDGNDFNGAAPCVIIRFNLEPTTIIQGLNPPRSGYVAIGPLADFNVLDSGVLASGAITGYQALADALAGNLENLVPPAVFYPIRVKTLRVAGVTLIVGWADIEGATVRAKSSFRRSRMQGD